MYAYYIHIFILLDMRGCIIYIIVGLRSRSTFIIYYYDGGVAESR